MKLKEAAERREREKAGRRGEWEKREGERERGKKRERERARGRGRTPTRLGGYVRIIILRYSHIYKSAI